MTLSRSFNYPTGLAPTGRSALVLAVASYAIGIAMVEWVSVAVFCRGDRKWGEGCGFAELYVASALIVFTPALVASLLTARACAPPDWRARLYGVAAGATILVAVLLEAVQLWDVVSLIIASGVAANIVRGVAWWLVPEA